MLNFFSSLDSIKLCVQFKHIKTVYGIMKIKGYLLKKNYSKSYSFEDSRAIFKLVNKYVSTRFDSRKSNYMTSQYERKETS